MNKQQYCRGCRNDFYNDGVRQCWSLQDAHIVQRYRIHWWTPQDTARNFVRVVTLDCHEEPGQFAFMRALPTHLQHEAHLVRSERLGMLVHSISRWIQQYCDALILVATQLNEGALKAVECVMDLVEAWQRRQEKRT